jgi:hypothetical protein
MAPRTNAARQRELDRRVQLYLARRQQQGTGQSGPLVAESGPVIAYEGPLISDAEVRRAAERRVPSLRQEDALKRQPETKVGPTDPDSVVRDDKGHIIHGEPRHSANTMYPNVGGSPYTAQIDAAARGEDYQPDHTALGDAYTRGLGEYWKYSNPTEAAALEASRRKANAASAASNPSSAQRAAMIRAYEKARDSSQYGNPGIVRTQNLFTESFDDTMRQAATATFGALNLDALGEGDQQYNEGTSSESLARYHEDGKKGRQEGQTDARGDVQDLRAGDQNASQAQRPLLVRNTVAGGLQAFQNLAGSNVDDYNATVVLLWDAGLIDGDLADAGLGNYTPQAGSALAKAMATVSQMNNAGNPITLTEYLESLKKSRQELLDQENQKKRTPRVYTDPEELKQTAKSAAQQLLGRELSADEEKQFLSKFRGLEDSAYGAGGGRQQLHEPVDHRSGGDVRGDRSRD